MAPNDFQARLQRIGAQPEAAAAVPPGVASPNPGAGSRFRASRAVFGALCSAAVALLFHNLQRISDAAPQSIRDSDTPGLMGAPIAILAAAWFIVIPLWFVATVVRASTRGSAPSSFVIGAFIVMAAYFAAIRFL